MPRTARAESPTGIYHVMLRGINRQRIFEDSEDYERYLYLLKRYKQECGYEILAWCLMPNHIHLLIRTEGSLSVIFRKLGASFVYWYNAKYDRVGHLFQDRFKSEPVDNERYLFTVLRYIHQNPVKAGLCKKAADYRYSSFSYYTDSDHGNLLDAEFILSLIGVGEFKRFHCVVNDDRCLDVDEEGAGRPRMTDSQVSNLLNKKHGIAAPSRVQTLDKTKQGEIIHSLLLNGASIRQVNRLTGVSIGTVRKYL